MIGLIFLIGIASLGITFWGAIKVADFHYKIKDTEAPLYFIYAFIFIAIWGAVALQICVSNGY